jgi:hypothetical protein
MSQAYSTSGGWGATAGHPELSAASRSKQYATNMDRIVAWSKKHPEIEIVSPDADDRLGRWIAQWRFESDVPDDQDRVIYQSDDLGMFMDYLENRFGKLKDEPEPEKKM